MIPGPQPSVRRPRSRRSWRPSGPDCIRLERDGHAGRPRLTPSLDASTSPAGWGYDVVAGGPAALADGDAVDDALVGVQELLDGQRPLHLAGVGGVPQRAGRN